MLNLVSGKGPKGDLACLEKLGEVEVVVSCQVMAAEAALSFSVASVVEDVLQQHGTRLKDLDFESRKAEEAGNSSILSSFFHMKTVLELWII